MLGITPLLLNNRTKVAPSFKGQTDDSVKENIDFYKEQVAELDQFLSEDYVSDKVKKPLKFFRVIANGAIDGLAVFGSTMMLAGFVKKSGARISSNKYVKQVQGFMQPAIDLIPKGYTKLKGALLNGLGRVVQSNPYQKFISTKLGKRIMTNVGVLAIEAGDLAAKLVKPFKEIKTDKLIKGVAAFLGVGSGVTGAYETTLDKKIPEQGVQDEANKVQEPDNKSEQEYREAA